MCGIAGQVALGEGIEVREAEVAAMAGALIHRGPDDQGFYTDPARRVCLGMRRLSIIDLVSGKQPMFNEDGTIACVLNGEIYNFQDLRIELEGKGHCFRTLSDTEAIVHLYEEEGPACVQRLRGMFAIAVWDQRRGMLLVARDRLGKKPLYYTSLGERLSFASEITALYGLEGLRRTLDPEALDLYLTYSYVPAPHSIVREIRKLPPAHVLLVENGRVSVRPYWRLAMTPTWDASREELVRTLRAKLEEAVRIRLISDVPLGCFLSGGVDSSAVVACMARLSRDPVKTFSIGFTHDRFNELPHARAVAELYRTDHHEYVVEADAIAVLPQLVRHFGEPFGDSSALPVWYLSKLTRQHVTVALNGDGGDELFGGYNWYVSGLRLERWAGRMPAWPLELAGRVTKHGARLGRLGARLRMPPAERFASLRSFLALEDKQRLYSPWLLAARGAEAERYLIDAYESGEGDTLGRMQFTDIATYLPEDLLVKVDRMTMAHSVEGRSPLLDHELLEFAARLPAGLKVGEEGTKTLFREAIEGLFPPGFLDRPKMGFSIPVADWLQGQLATTVRARVAGGPLRASGWFNPGALTEICDQHVAGARDWSAQLWNLLMLAEWVETFSPASA
jgi:asparagine synthase (glutamine-hydrolysing)